MIKHYYFDGQLRKYLLQFCYIFAGLRVRVGKDETCTDQQEFLTVPISLGSRDRVAAALVEGNTRNNSLTLPRMCAHITGTQLGQMTAGRAFVDTRNVLPAGGVFPDDLVTVKRVKPVPYDLTIDLDIYASNTYQMHQIKEQLMLIFNPSVQIQTSDKPLDWARLSEVILTSISDNENFPAGSDKRIIQSTFSFSMPIFISGPADFRDEVIRKVTIELGDKDKFEINEIGTDGQFVDNGVWKSIEIDG